MKLFNILLLILPFITNVKDVCTATPAHDINFSSTEATSIKT